MFGAYTQFLDLYTLNLSVRENHLVCFASPNAPAAPAAPASAPAPSPAAEADRIADLQKRAKADQDAAKKETEAKKAEAEKAEKIKKDLQQKDQKPDDPKPVEPKPTPPAPPKKNNGINLLPESKQISIDAIRSGATLGAVAPIATTAGVAGVAGMTQYGTLAGMGIGAGALASSAALAYAGGRMFGAKGAVAGAGLGVAGTALAANVMGAASLPLGTSVALPAAAGVATGVGLNYLGAGHNKLWGTESKTLAGRMSKGLASPLSYPVGAYARINDYVHNREATTGADMLATRAAPDIAKGTSLGIAGGLIAGGGLAVMPAAIGAGLLARPAVGFGAKMHEKFWTDGQTIQNPAARIAMGLLSPLSVPYKALGGHYMVKKGPWALLKSIKSLWTGSNAENEGLGSVSGAVLSRPMSWLKKGGRGIKWMFTKNEGAVSAAAQQAAEIEMKQKAEQTKADLKNQATNGSVSRPPEATAPQKSSAAANASLSA